MTRINIGINPKYLTDEHLLAEHREIKRLPACLQTSIKSGGINKIPDTFTLGKGHVLFFLNKMWFTYIRYCDIYDELRRRGFNVTRFGSNWKNVPHQYFKNYLIPKDEIGKIQNIVFNRISYRIAHSTKKVWHYYGKPISKEEAIEMIRQSL